MNDKTYENYPWWSIAIAISLQLGIYAIAGFIIYQFGLIWFLIYLVYFTVLELTFYPKACVYCYYYGKWCFIGKGKMAAWLRFKQKDNKKFCERKATFINILPELLVVIVPVILGIILLVQEFSLLILILVILDAMLWMFGNALVRGKLACAHCKQGRICCPAKDLFGRKNG